MPCPMYFASLLKKIFLPRCKTARVSMPEPIAECGPHGRSCSEGPLRTILPPSVAAPSPRHVLTDAASLRRTAARRRRRPAGRINNKSTEVNLCDKRDKTASWHVGKRLRRRYPADIVILPFSCCCGRNLPARGVGKLAIVTLTTTTVVRAALWCSQGACVRRYGIPVHVPYIRTVLEVEQGATNQAASSQSVSTKTNSYLHKSN